MAESCIPIVIGVTGHRNLRPEELEPLRELVTQQLKALQCAYPSSTLWMLNSLAVGADTLCAEVALELGIRLICPLPMPAEDYAVDFDGAHRERFFRLLSQSQSFLCPHVEPEKTGRDYLYRQAGLYVASYCHILLALWDGSDEKKDGCGTAAAVYYARHGCVEPDSSVLCEKPVSILHVQVNRAGSETHAAVCARWLDGGPDTDLLSRTDRFNADAEKTGISPGCSPLLPTHGNTPQIRRLEEMYQKADSLSVSCQKRYTRALLAAAVCCVLLVLSYLLYDELDTRGFLILYGVIMAGYGLGYRWICKRQFLESYLQYRLLAETARVQCYISGLGFGNNTAAYFTWTQKQDAAWIQYAVSAALIGPAMDPILSAEEARTIWIQEQLQYHEHAQVKTQQKHRLNQRICKAVLLGMIAAFVLTFGLEYGFQDYVTGSEFLGLSPQSWMKILWGSLSAVTLFASDYFGKLSLDRKQVDHRKMACLFRCAQQSFGLFPQNRDVLFQKLAAEELIENGNWYSYCQENTISFDL